MGQKLRRSVICCNFVKGIRSFFFAGTLYSTITLRYKKAVNNKTLAAYFPSHAHFLFYFYFEIF